MYQKCRKWIGRNGKFIKLCDLCVSNPLNGFDLYKYLPVWPEKNRQMFIKVA